MNRLSEMHGTHLCRPACTSAARAFYSIAIALCALATTVPTKAAVNDVFPGDYTTLPPGFTTVTGYVYLRREDGFYAHGDKQLDGKLDVPIAALRVSHFIKVGDHTFAPMIVVGTAGINASPDALSNQLGPNAHGTIDMRLGGTLWLIENPAVQEYLAVTGTAILPTGNYDASKLLNIGENRKTFVVSGGWVKQFGKAFSLEILPEAAVYTDNTRFMGHSRLGQAATYTLGSTLRYYASPQAQWFLGALTNRGGAITVDGVDQDNAARNTRITAGASYLTQNRQQWMMRYGRDVAIRNGFKIANELAVRYLSFF